MSQQSDDSDPRITAQVEPTKEVVDEERLTTILREQFAGAANNGTLREALRWQANRYWSVRNRLLDRGVVQKAHGGPGGTTLLVKPPEPLASQAEAAAPIEAAVEIAREIKAERDLYPSVLRQITTNWASDEGYDDHIARVTAALGARDTGGKWTRPDISVVAVQKFKFLRDPVFDVITFEVKPGWNITVEAVFEALAHRQTATRAYALYHATEDAFRNVREAGRIVALAEQHGVGILLASDPDDYETWIERVRARRWNPAPDELNDFIQRTFPSSDHDEIIKLNK